MGGGDGRLATVTDDFLLDPQLRLTEQNRALMTRMLLTLVGTIADEIRVRLPEVAASACDCPSEQVAEELRRSDLLRHAPLIALLLRRADEARCAQALPAAPSPLQGWTADEVPAVAAAAMAVVLARAASRDRFGQPGLELGDCDGETAVALSYAVAAMLAGRAPSAEEAILAATVDLLGCHDEGQRLHAVEARLVMALEASGRLNGELLTTLAASGEVGLLAQALGRLGGIAGDSAWTMFFSPHQGSIALLLRIADQPRAVAARLLATLAVWLGGIDPLAEIERFDRLSDGQMAEHRIRLRHPPAFAAALAALGHG
jgi:hypothetical protein